MDNNIEDQLKNLKRRMDSIQKTLDLLYNDRTLMEDMVSRLSSVENALHLNREHQTEVQKNLHADIQEVQHNTEDKVNEMKEAIGEKTVIVKSEKGSVIEWIVARLKKGGKK